MINLLFIKEGIASCWEFIIKTGWLYFELKNEKKRYKDKRIKKFIEKKKKKNRKFKNKTRKKNNKETTLSY